MIKTIKMSNIKGQNSEQELTGRDIIIGHNGAGKTTRLQSIGLSVLGYVPGKGKTLADTFELASEDTMAVGLDTDDFSFRREFKKSTKLDKYGATEVKITQNINVSPSQGESSNKQKEARIKAEMGDFPAMLDFGAFISLTDNKKRDFLYNLGGNHFSWDRDRVASHLSSEVLTDTLRETNSEMYEVMDRDVADTMRQFQPNAEVQDGLLAMMEHAKERLSYWKKEKITADGAAKKLTEIKNRARDTDRDLAINQDKLNELQDEREALIAEIATITANNHNVTVKQQELNSLREEIEVLSDNNGDAGALEDLNANGTELAHEIERLRNRIAEVEQEIESRTAEQMDAVRKSDAITNDIIHALNMRQNTINVTIKTKSDLMDKISESNGCCAFDSSIKCGQDFSEFLAGEQDEIDRLYEELDHIADEIAENKSKCSDYLLQANSAGAIIGSWRHELAELQKELHGAQQNFEKTRDAVREIENKAPTLMAKREQEAKIQSYIDENPMVDLSGKHEEKRLIEERITALQGTIDEQKKIRNDIINIRANIIDSQTASYEVECWKQIVEAIGQKGVQGQIVKEMLDPIREDVDAKLAEMNIPYRFYFETESDTGKEIFEFGFTTDYERRPFDALSTGEQLLMTIALMTTIIEKSNPPVKVLAIDNIDSLDSSNMKKVIDGVNCLAKNMDNIILCGVAEFKDEDAPEWKIWRL